MTLSRIQHLVIPWTTAYQAPLSMGFSRQEYWSGLPLPFPLCCTSGTKTETNIDINYEYIDVLEQICLCFLIHCLPLYQRRQWHPTPVLLPGKSRGRRSPVGCSPWGCSESDRTELLQFHFSPSCIGEGNGNPLQYSCLENPRDRGAWWAAVYGVAQSRTRLKQLSSSEIIR